MKKEITGKYKVLSQIYIAEIKEVLTDTNINRPFGKNGMTLGDYVITNFPHAAKVVVCNDGYTAPKVEAPKVEAEIIVLPEAVEVVESPEAFELPEIKEPVKEKKKEDKKKRK